MLKQFKISKKWSYISYLAMFLVMLVANILTPIVSDDFTYLFSFAGNRERIKSISDIFISLEAHGRFLNGRYAAHFFSHLFLMLPGWIFDIVNAVVFVLQVFIITQIATYKKEKNNILSVFLFGMLWLCQCQFGQVNLWLDGSCNYLWSVFFGLLLVSPYIMYLLYDVTLPLPLLFPFLIVALLSGNFMENVSPAFIFVAFMCMVASKLIFKKRIRYEQILGIIFSSIGFVIMMIAPGEWVNKVSDGEASTVFTNIFVALGMVAELVVPLTIFVIIALRIRKDNNKKPVYILSLILLIGALASNFVMIVAAYYALRSSIGCTSLVLFAVTFLIAEEKLEFKGKIKVAAALLASSIVLAMSIGFIDITRTFVLIERNEKTIIEAKKKGESYVKIPNIVPFTKYSGSYRLIYINIEDPYGWPNNMMAKYYGLEYIACSD